MKNESHELLEMTSRERLEAYNLIISGCSHIWSKGKLQEDKAQKVLEVLVPLTQKDPYFLAHLTSYSMKHSKDKDLRVFLAYVSGLSSADGSAFSPDSKYKKPNLRYISAAAIHMLEPKLVDRVALLAERKFKVDKYLGEAVHFPTSMRTSLSKYLAYREAHPEYLEGIRKAGLKTTIQRLARKLHYNLSDEAREVIDWPRRGQKIEKRKPLFEAMTDLEIAEKIRSEKIPYFGSLAELSKINKKMSPVIAVAMLEQSTGNQAVILRATFEDNGILNDPEVSELYAKKVSEAKTALDRVDHLTKDASEAVKNLLKSARSTSRKDEMGDIGKVFLHLDFSGSMTGVKEFAEERGALIAEMVKDPEKNFAWGWFSHRGHLLPLPQTFEADAFRSVLFGQGDGGGTQCYALYEDARRFGADVDVFVTDQQAYDFSSAIKSFHRANPDMKMPKACVVINYAPPSSYSIYRAVKHSYEEVGIPVVELDPSVITQTAVVTEALRAALLGPTAIIDTIMDTELLKLPDYYYSL